MAIPFDFYQIHHHSRLAVMIGALNGSRENPSPVKPSPSRHLALIDVRDIQENEEAGQPREGQRQWLLPASLVVRDE